MTDSKGNTRSMYKVQSLVHRLKLHDQPIMNEAADKIAELQIDLNTLVMFISGTTPDRNTQTDEEFLKTLASVEGIITRCSNRDA